MKNLALILSGVLLLAGLFWWMKPSPPGLAPSAAQAVPALAAAGTPPPAAQPAPQVFELVARAGQLASGPSVISVVEGTAVTLRITADHHDELHLHGYDLTLKLPTAQPVELAFVADRTGRFEYELHHAHAALGVLEVHPR